MPLPHLSDITRLIDLRILLDRDGRVALYADRRAVLDVPKTCEVNVALGDLARRLECLAWSEGRTALAILGDPESVLYKAAS